MRSRLTGVSTPHDGSPRALFDTNVVASAITSPRGASRALLEYALRGSIELVTSPTLLDELVGCLIEVFKFEPATAGAVRVALESLCELVEPAEVPSVSRDPDDDHVLAAALAGGAEHIVTRDKDLLTLGTYGGIAIVEPAPFLHLVRQLESPKLR